MKLHKIITRYYDLLIINFSISATKNLKPYFFKKGDLYDKIYLRKNKI